MRRAENSSLRHGIEIRRNLRPAGQSNGLIDVVPALVKSRVEFLYGRPYPVQFRNQGAFDAWKQLLGHTDVWPIWAHPQTICWDIRQDILRHLNHMPLFPTMTEGEDGEKQAKHHMLGIEISANLMYFLRMGTVIEATPALETLLANSEIDLDLPMSMVAPPYSAQYLHFGETATRHLKAPDSDAPDQCFDGVFCFYTPPSELSIRGAESWTLELIFVGKRQDRCNGMVTLLGETDRGSTTVGQWLDGVLGPVEGKSVDGYIRPMRAAVSYVVKVFLYMALKQARTIERQNYDQAMQRVNGLGVKKRAKLLQRMQSLYNGILVGPEALPLEPLGSRSANGMPPHWRRGHFRMQPHGPGKQERKLIFVAPVLIHADQLQGEAPLPKPYRAAAIAVTTSA